MEYICITLISHFVELLLLSQKTHLVIKLTIGKKSNKSLNPDALKN